MCHLSGQVINAPQVLEAGVVVPQSPIQKRALDQLDSLEVRECRLRRSGCRIPNERNDAGARFGVPDCFDNMASEEARSAGDQIRR